MVVLDDEMTILVFEIINCTATYVAGGTCAGASADGAGTGANAGADGSAGGSGANALLSIRNG